MNVSRAPWKSNISATERHTLYKEKLKWIKKIDSFFKLKVYIIYNFSSFMRYKTRYEKVMAD